MLPEDLAAIHVNVRECWILVSDFRVSCKDRPFDDPCLRAIVLETVEIDESHRRRGVFSRFLVEFVAQPGYDLFVVEGVQSPHLADYLMRRGWDFDARVMDFYLRPPPRTTDAPG